MTLTNCHFIHLQIQHDCTILTDKCINAKRQDNKEPASLRINQSFFYDSPDKTKRGLTLAVVTGDIDCKYWLADGLRADVAAAKQLSNKALRSAVRDRPARWKVEPDRMPDEAQPYSYDFAEVTCFIKQLKFLSSHVAKKKHRSPTPYGCASRQCSCRAANCHSSMLLVI